MKKRYLLAAVAAVVALAPNAKVFADNNKKQLFYDTIKAQVNTDDIDFTQIATIASGNGNGVNAYKEKGKNIYYFRGEVDNNNVIWADKCWKIVRTTFSGGTKMIYNGVPNADGQCTATETDALISYNGSNSFSFNDSHYSPADIGYMYGERYEYVRTEVGTAGQVFANDVDYDEATGAYTLRDTFTLTDWQTDYQTIAQRYHYTCVSSATSCSDVYYLVHLDSHSHMSSNRARSLILSDGEKIEDVKEKMFANAHDSIAKATIEAWFEQESLGSHENDLEDAVFCNDRSIYDGLLKSKDDTYSTNKDFFYFGAASRNSLNSEDGYKPSLDCANRNDAFTKEDTVNGNAKLKHKVGLITADELTMAGTVYYTNNAVHDYLYINSYSWSISPFVSNWGSITPFAWNNDLSPLGFYSSGLRPMVSLKANAYYTEGDGTKEKPYIFAGLYEESGNNDEKSEPSKKSGIKNPDTADPITYSVMTIAGASIFAAALVLVNKKRR